MRGGRGRRKRTRVIIISSPARGSVVFPKCNGICFFFKCLHPAIHSQTRAPQPYSQILPLRVCASLCIRLLEQFVKGPTSLPTRAPLLLELLSVCPPQRRDMEGLTRLVTNSLRNPGGITKLWSFSLADPSQGRRERLHKVSIWFCWGRRDAWEEGKMEGGRRRTCRSPSYGLHRGRQ